MIPFNNYRNKKKKIQFTHQTQSDEEFSRLLNQIDEEFLKRVSRNYSQFRPVYTDHIEFDWKDLGEILDSSN